MLILDLKNRLTENIEFCKKTLESTKKSKLVSMVLQLNRYYSKVHLLRHPIKTVKHYKLVQSAYRQFLKDKLKYYKDLLKTINRLKDSGPAFEFIRYDRYIPRIKGCDRCYDTEGFFSKELNKFIKTTDIYSRNFSSYVNNYSDLINYKVPYSLETAYSVLTGYKGFELYLGMKPYDSILNGGKKDKLSSLKIFLIEKLEELLKVKYGLNFVTNQKFIDECNDITWDNYCFTKLRSNDSIKLEFENETHWLQDENAAEFFEQLRDFVPNLQLSWESKR